MKLKKIISLCLLLALGFQLAGCGGASTEDTQAPTLRPAEQEAPTEALGEAGVGFAVDLLKNAYKEGENCILSPYSILSALAMAANGAEGETLTQMEQTMGMSREALNAFLKGTVESSKDTGLVSANSLWLREGFGAEEAFIANLKNNFDAEVFNRPFDGETKEEINGWVSDHTAGRIPSIIDSLEPEALMVLVNALTFDGKWENPFEAEGTTQGVFHAPGGEQTVDMMHTLEGADYLESDEATGFLKDYEGGRYTYLALLPKEGRPMEDFVEGLSGEKLLSLISNGSRERVQITMPRYRLEESYELKEILSAMGITDAFTEQANFEDISREERVYISQVLHKTYLQVDEEGTEAAAATAIIMEKATAAMTNIKEVTLDRPFVMGIFDRTTQNVIFLGVVNSAA